MAQIGEKGMNMMSDTQTEALLSGNSDSQPVIKMRGEDVDVFYGAKQALFGVTIDRRNHSPKQRVGAGRQRGCIDYGEVSDLRIRGIDRYGDIADR